VTPSAILFDAVGTLIFPRPDVAEAYQAAGKRFGSRLESDEIRWRFREAFARQEQRDAAGSPVHATDETRERQRWRTIVGEVFADVSDAEGLFEALWEHFAQPQHWQVYDDVADCLAELRSCGCRLGIASNFDDRLDAICQSQPVLHLLPRFVSSRIGHKKPSPEFFRAIERILDLPPERILLVGDDLENDFLAARRAGWQAVSLDRDLQQENDLAPAPSIASLLHLGRFIRFQTPD
jgi:putative hydrolase of the HAD superfamily